MLSAEEGRVLGCLLEKEATTPEYYPLTLNALRNACNQSSSRQPVVSYDDGDVSRALASLREKALIRIVYSQSNRAAKYRHVLDEALGLDLEGRAIVCLLLLRGPQTVGELRTRSERLAGFESLEAVDEALSRLSDRDEPLVVRLDRAPGQKEARHRQLLAAEEGIDPDPGPVHRSALADQDAAPDTGSPGTDSPGPGSGSAEQQLGALRAEVAELRSQVSGLAAEVERLGGLLDSR